MRNIQNLSTQERIEALIKDNFPTTDVKTVTYTAGGDGATGALTLFSVTGQIKIVSLIPFCTTDLTETAGTVTTLLGVVGDTNLFLDTTEPEDIDVGKFWHATAQATIAGIAIPASLKDIVISADIIQTIVTSTISGGVMDFYLQWIPLSSDAAVVVA